MIQAITGRDAFGPPIWVVLKATLSSPTPGSSYLSGLGARDPHCISLPWCLFENFPSLVLLYPLLAMWLSENLKSQHSNHTHVNLHNVWFQKLALSQTRINSLNHLSHKITSQQALKKKKKERVLRKEKATQHPVKWDFQPLQQTPWNATWHSFTWRVKLSTKKGESQVPEKQAELEVAGASARAANEGLWLPRGWGFNPTGFPRRRPWAPPDGKLEKTRSYISWKPVKEI